MIERFRIKIERILLVGLLIPIIGMVLSYYRGFNWIYDDLSYFGNVNPLFNIGLVTSGLILFFFTKATLTRIRIGAMAHFFMVIASISVVLTGLIRNNVNRPLHFVCAACFFFALAYAQLILGKAIIKDKRSLGIFSILVSIVNYIIWGAFFTVWTFDHRIGYAIPELLYMLITLTWIFVFIFDYNNDDKIQKINLK